MYSSTAVVLSTLSSDICITLHVMYEVVLMLLYYEAAFASNF